MQFWLKTLISALMIAGISELGKRSSFLGALLASLPLTSVLAFIWLYTETRNPVILARLSVNVFWLVWPSLLLFIVFPVLLKRQMSFYPALLIACALTSLAYLGMVILFKKIGISLD